MSNRDPRCTDTEIEDIALWLWEKYSDREWSNIERESAIGIVREDEKMGLDNGTKATLALIRRVAVREREAGAADMRERAAVLVEEATCPFEHTVHRGIANDVRALPINAGEQ